MRILILLFFTLNFLTAQKVVEKSIVDRAVTYFQIDASNCFEITIDTQDTDTVIVAASLEGEYHKDLVLNVQEVGSEVLVNAGFRPNYKTPNDKLSAHKVVSISLKIIVPEHKNVQVFGTSCRVQVNGSYQRLKVTLNDGASYLNQVNGLVEVSTQSGDIIVESAAAEIRSKSKYGKVVENRIPNGDNMYLLNTVTGNILLKRIE